MTKIERCKAVPQPSIQGPEPVLHIKDGGILYSGLLEQSVYDVAFLSLYSFSLSLYFSFICNKNV